jgi:fatty acid desaturase
LNMSALQNNQANVRTRDDYRLIGGASARAQAAGLVNAQWYKCPVSRPVMKTLMQRSDGAAIRDTLLWYALIIAAGVLAYRSWGTWWAVPAFLLYGTLYCSPADSRWHEAGHGTAFKTRWMNDVLYQLACFQVLRRPTAWRWSHARHHTDTMIVGRDPEVAVPVPTDWTTVFGNIFALKHAWFEIGKWLRNVAGTVSEEDKTFVPEMAWGRIIVEARIWAVLYAVVMAACVYSGSVMPLLFIGLPSLYGAWLYHFFGLTQHAGLPDNVTDHRKNSRTVYMNPVFRFLYWNMNYHLDHHMYPMVPYHALPDLHEAIKADCPPAYPSTWAAYREIIPAIRRQANDPSHYVTRPLPAAPIDMHTPQAA